MYPKIRKRKQKIEKEIKQIEKQLQKLPEGNLWIRLDNGQPRYYERKKVKGKEKRTYLGRKKIDLAASLAMKVYLNYRLEDLSRENAAIERYFRAYDGSSKTEKLINEKSPILNLLQNQLGQMSVELKEWQAQEYASSAPHQESRNHKSPFCMVRSKSEAHIAWALYNHHIPYRYECDLQTETATYYPDFTIRHPKTGELYIWEHFGMMDNPTYYQTAFGKMETYNKLGYVLSVNFIATFETSSHPLDFELVEAIIQHYFS